MLHSQLKDSPKTTSRSFQHLSLQYGKSLSYQRQAPACFSLGFSGLTDFNAFPSLVKLISSSVEKLSKNSSASSIMSTSVKGFLSMATSNLYLAELKIIMSASMYA